MVAHNLLACLLSAMAAWGASSVTPALSEPEVPPLTDAHKQYLSRIARRTLRDAILGRARYQPRYVPQALESLEAEIVVRVRDQGYLRAVGAAGPSPIVGAVRDAALAAHEMLLHAGPVELDEINRMLVEIEALGPPQALEISADWTQPRALDPCIEPGVHGMVLERNGRSRRFCPSELITSNMILADALSGLAKLMFADPSQVPDARLMRFRTVHWYQHGTGSEVVSLHRGMTYVPPAAVSPSALDEACDRLAAYLVYRQRPSGLYAYEYDPAEGAYSDEDNFVRQAGAVMGAAYHAARAGSSASQASADLALRFHLEHLADIPGVPDAAFIATPDGLHKLGATALIAAAMGVHPDAGRYAQQRRKLVNGMLWLQHPSGLFVTAFPPAQRIDGQEYFPGEALLALAIQYEHEPSARILDAFDLAIGFYREYFRGTRSPAFVPWQVQAYAIMARHTRRSDYAEYVFDLTDWLIGMQMTESNCPWPELHGGIASHQAGRAGVATSSYLEGFADALELAKRGADEARTKRYAHAVRLAARFVMQLQVRPEEAYFVRTPRDVVGAIRTTPSLSRLRIDHCQHALIALLKTRQALYSDGG